MAVIPLGDPAGRNVPPPRFPLLQLGFRPFFLLAGLSAVLLMLVWLHVLAGGPMPALPFAGSLWHGHEMLFGYTAAAIAGFLLTAVRNWTGVQTIQNLPLGLLALLWLAGRLLPLVGAPAILVAIVDIAFFPALALAIAVPLIRADSRSNLLFIPVLLLFGAAELIFQLGVLQLIDWGMPVGLRLALNMVILLLVIMGGRVIPFFCERGTGQAVKPASPLLERLLYLSLGLWLLADGLRLVWPTPTALISLLALIAAGLQLARWARWYVPASWGVPMVWILLLGYLWIPLGLLLRVAGYQTLIADSIATHAFTAGAIGMVTIGMMSRVSLGHSGREVMHNTPIVVGFLLITAASLSRVMLPLLTGVALPLELYVAGGLWAAGFALFSLVFYPILSRPRIDGRPG